MIHVDLDGASEIFAAHRVAWSAPDDPIFETGMQHVLDFLDENGVKATLFAIAANLEDPGKRALLEEAVRRGHEIASHTMTHRNLRQLDSHRKRRELRDSRERLQAELGVKVRGFRAPGYSIDREGLEILSDAGYVWDSSAFQTKAFASRLSVDLDALTDTRRPFPGNPLVELALPTHIPSSVPLTPSYALVLGRRFHSWGFQRYARTGRSLVLLLHLVDLASPLPPDRLPGWKLRLFTLSALSVAAKRERCQQILEQVRRTYRLMTTAALLQEEGVA